MQKLKVLFLHTATRPPLGADTWVHVHIIRHLDRARHEVHVACSVGPPGAPTPTFQELSAIEDLHLHPVDLGPELHGLTRGARAKALFKSFIALVGLVRLAALVRTRRIDVVHTSDRPRDALTAVLLGRATRARAVVHVHVGYGDWMGRPLKWSLKRADALIAISDFVAETLIAAGHDPARIRVVRNGIEPCDWNPAASGDALRADLDIPLGADVVLTVCRLFPSKGPADLIRVLPYLFTNDARDTYLLIAGKEMVPGYRRELEGLAESLGVADRVILTGHRSDVEALMAAADVFAMPSLGEPFGLVYLEAMAMRLPVIALDSGGAPEVVVQGCTGFLTEPGDSESLQSALARLLGSPALRESMGEMGRLRVEDEFTCARVADDVQSVYGWLVRKHEAGALEWGRYPSKT